MIEGNVNYFVDGCFPTVRKKMNDKVDLESIFKLFSNISMSENFDLPFVAEGQESEVSKPLDCQLTTFECSDTELSKGLFLNDADLPFVAEGQESEVSKPLDCQIETMECTDTELPKSIFSDDGFELPIFPGADAASKKILSSKYPRLEKTDAYKIASWFVEKSDLAFSTDGYGKLYLFNNAYGFYELLDKDRFAEVIIDNSLEAFKGGLTKKMIADIYFWLLKNKAFVGEKNYRNLPGMANFQNGVFSAEDEVLLEHGEQYGFTYCINAKFNATAELSEPVKRFFNNLGCNNPRTIADIFAIIGFALLNETRLQKFAYIYGEGGNGKSLLSKLILNLLPRQVVAGLSIEDFGDKFTFANLEGAIVSISSDEKNSKVGPASVARLKQIVAGDYMEAQKNSNKL